MTAFSVDNGRVYVALPDGTYQEVGTLTDIGPLDEQSFVVQQDTVVTSVNDQPINPFALPAGVEVEVECGPEGLQITADQAIPGLRLTSREATQLEAVLSSPSRDILEDIDSAIEGWELWSDDAATWKADGSHEEPEPPYWTTRDMGVRDRWSEDDLSGMTIHRPEQVVMHSLRVPLTWGGQQVGWATVDEAMQVTVHERWGEMAALLQDMALSMSVTIDRAWQATQNALLGFSRAAVRGRPESPLWTPLPPSPSLAWQPPMGSTGVSVRSREQAEADFEAALWPTGRPSYTPPPPPPLPPSARAHRESRRRRDRFMR